MLHRNRKQLRATSAQTDFFKVLASALQMTSTVYRIHEYKNSGLMRLVGEVTRLSIQLMPRYIHAAISHYNDHFQPDDPYTLEESDYKTINNVKYIRELYVCKDGDSVIEILAIEGDFNAVTLSASINLV